VNTAADHYVIESSRLHEMTNLPFGNANPLGELLWRFQPFICVVLIGHLSL